MDLQEKIEALEKEFNEKIEILKSEAQQENEFPKDGDSFYSISETGNIEGGMIWGGYPVDMNRMAIGNIFQTKEQAEFALEKIKVETELRKFSKPFEKWGDNFVIVFDGAFSEQTIKNMSIINMQGAIYFESEEKAQQAIKSVGEERIKKYIFGVEG